MGLLLPLAKPRALLATSLPVQGRPGAACAFRVNVPKERAWPRKCGPQAPQLFAQEGPALSASDTFSTTFLGLEDFIEDWDTKIG